MKRRLTISIFTENKYGLLNRVTIVFTRRKLNIQSITASEAEIPGIYRLTIVLTTERDMAEKVVKQLEKLVGVARAFLHEEDEIHHQEIALYKVSTNVVNNGIRIENVVRDNHARILTVESEYFIIEKTGHDEEIEKLYDILEPYGVLEFARSGRVYISKPMKQLNEHLIEMENLYK